MPSEEPFGLQVLFGPTRSLRLAFCGSLLPVNWAQGQPASWHVLGQAVGTTGAEHLGVLAQTITTPPGSTSV